MRMGKVSASTWLGAGFLVGLLVAPPMILAEEEEPRHPPGVGVWKAELAGLRVREIVLPESPLAAAPWPGGGLAVLAHAVDPEDSGSDEETPRVLYRLRGLAEDLEPVARDLPADLDAVARVGDALWLGGEGVIWELRGSELQPVLEQPGLDLAALEEAGLLGDGELWVPDVGVLRHFRSGGTRVPAGEVVLPVEAERRRRRLLVRSPAVARTPDGHLIAGPLVQGNTRVRHLLLGDGEPVEAWSRLPGPEDVDAFWYADLGGEPVFLASTTEADRLGVFEKSKLRLFRLTADRTRAGRRPLLAIDTETKSWYRFEPLLLDADGDGIRDLVLIQPQGMAPGDLVVDIYKGHGGRFDSRPRSTDLDAESARWHFGSDLDGDGAPDLVVGTGALEIYRGLAEHRRRAVEKEPWRRLDRAALRTARREVAKRDESAPVSDDRPSFRGRQRVHDLDGDGRLDLAVVRPHRGRTVVRLVGIVP